MRARGKILGLVPYDLRAPSVERARRRLWNERDGRFLVPVVFGAGWTLNLRSAPRHPLQALLLALILWWWRARRRV